MKTHKATVKRFKITKNKKILHRTCGQDHFNTRDTGKKTLNKRRDKRVSKSCKKTISRLTSS